MKEYLWERNFRNYLIFRVGINLGLSVQDLLSLKVEDLLDLFSLPLDIYTVLTNGMKGRFVQWQNLNAAWEKSSLKH